MNNDLNNRLLTACKDGDLEEAKLLTKQGADVNYKDDDGWTVLMWACLNERLDVAEYLVEQGADLEAKDKWGDTALTLACIKGNLDVAKYLVDNGADLEVKNNREFVAYYLARRRGGFDVYEYLKHLCTNDFCNQFRFDFDLKIKIATPKKNCIANDNAMFEFVYYDDIEKGLKNE